MEEKNMIKFNYKVGDTITLQWTGERNVANDMNQTKAIILKFKREKIVVYCFARNEERTISKEQVFEYSKAVSDYKWSTRHQDKSINGGIFKIYSEERI